MEVIFYKRKSYPIRKARHKAGGLVKFSTESLNKEIVKNISNGYKDAETQLVDEEIYGFVQDEVLLNTSDREFEKYVNKYFD